MILTEKLAMGLRKSKNKIALFCLFAIMTRKGGDMMEKVKKKKIHVSFDPKILDEIDKQCDELKVDRSTYISTVLSKYTLDLKKKKGKKGD